MGTAAFSWHELSILVTYAGPDSALARARAATNPATIYEPADHLLIAVLNQLRGISWQLSGDDSTTPPEPHYLPGLEPAPDQLGDAMTIDEMDQRLAPYMPPLT